MSKTVFHGDLKEDGKGALRRITDATTTNDMTSCVRSVLIQIDVEMRRQGITNFAFSDIQLRKPPR